MDRPDNSDIVDGVRAGRLSAETARRMMEIRAHSHQSALKEAHQALDRGHPASYPDDEFAKLFPPTGPNSIGPPADDEEDEDSSDQIRRPAKVSDQEKRPTASAHEPYTEDELFRRLYGRAPKPGELDD